MFRGGIFRSEKARFSLLSFVGIVYLEFTRSGCMYQFWESSLMLCRQITHGRRANAPGSFRHDVTSTCFDIKIDIFPKFWRALYSMLGIPGIYHAHTLPQFMHRLIIVPRSLRSLLVSYGKRCAAYVVYASVFQHSYVHTHRKHIVFLALVCDLFF